MPDGMNHRPPLNLSLNTRLWLALALCILPLFVLTTYDYQKDRERALHDITHQGKLILNGALISEEAAIRQVEMTLRSMAGANDLLKLDPAECSALAGRLQMTHPDLANLGAVTPQGELFCSAVQAAGKINVADRAWFLDAQTTQGLTQGQFLIGRASKQPGATFGFPLRSASGELRAVLFASSSTRWFDRFTRISNLPEDWNSLLLRRNGQVLSRFPETEAYRGKTFSEKSQQRLQVALSQNEDSVIMQGLDGRERLYVMAPLQITQGELIAMVAIPTESTLGFIEQQYYWRLLLLLLLTAGSLLLARHLLRELVDRRFRQTLDELKRLQEALDHVPAFVFMQDTAHRYVYANRKTLELFGISREELPGYSDAQFFSSATAKQVHAIDQKVFSGCSTDEIIDTHDTPQGRRIYHEIKTPVYDTPNNVLWGLCGISTDITEHYLAEESIRKLSWVIEQSPEGIIFTRLNGEIEYVNDAFERITGYSRAEVIGKNPRILQSGKTARKVYESLWATLAQGQPWHGEFLNRHKDGHDYIESASISPVRQADGRITHYVALQADITEQRENEIELTEYRAGLERLVRERTFELAVAKEAAEGANKAKSAFLANMSHEIRTPMNAIIGLNYLLLQGELPPEQADKVRKVSHAAEHLLQIINDILDLSKIEAGKLQLESIPFSPREVVDTVSGMIRERALGKGLALHIASDGLPNQLIGDAMRLRQILLNFASNALKFTEHGSITISAEALSRQDETVECRFTVRDTGIGIRADKIPRLFTAFEQLESSTTRRYGGSGLGLVIARHLSQLMGGEIGVDSAPGMGSTFWVSARFKQGAPTPLADAEMTGWDGQLSGRILLAEDEPINQEIACELLASMGLQVLAVNDGQAAVDRYREDEFDLILMDMQMPILDGIDATIAIRAQPEGRSVPIIALTANAFAEDRQRCIAAGMSDFLAKPVNPERLYNVLARYLLTDKASPPSDEARPLARLDETQLLADLPILRCLLLSGDIEANGLYEKLRDTVEASAPQESRQLARHMNKYDFESAAAIVGLLLSKLESSQSVEKNTGGDK